MRLDAFNLAAVHSHRASSHPFRLGRHKERHEVSNLFWLPVAANSGLGGKLFHGLFNRHVVGWCPLLHVGLAAVLS